MARFYCLDLKLFSDLSIYFPTATIFYSHDYGKFIPMAAPFLQHYRQTMIKL